jgi:O-antigen/teichoic acid export membrane protein
VVSSALIGLHRSDLKSQIAVVGLACQLIVSLATINWIGIRGVAVAQILQSLVLMFAGWALLLRQLGKPIAQNLPRRFNPARFKELLHFGLRLQAVNISSFLFEPTMKFVMSAVAGVAALGIFEMAWRLIMQLRQVVVAPTQNLVPVFATQAEPAELRLLYHRSFAAISLLAAAALSIATISSPLIIYLWLGHVEWLFVAFIAIMAPGWLLHIACVPAFLLGIAQGRLRWDVASNAVAVAVGPLVALIIAPLFPAIAVAIGASVATAAAGLIAIGMNCRVFGIPVVPPRFVWYETAYALRRGHIRQPT